jgi:hypothetical protein
MRVIGILLCLFAIFGFLRGVLSIIVPEHFTLGMRQPLLAARLLAVIVCMFDAGLFFGGLWLMKSATKHQTDTRSPIPRPNHRASSWPLIVSFFVMPVILLFAASLRPNQPFPIATPGWLPTLRWAMIAMSVASVAYIYIFERKLLALLQARGPLFGRSPHERLLILGLACCATPATTGLLLFLLGARFSELVYLALASTAAVAVWSIRWLRQTSE